MAGIKKSYDHIVVGGGTAGALIASRLSDDPDRTVLLIEAGPRDDFPLFSIPGAAFLVYNNLRHAWGYLTEPQAAMKGRRLTMTQAKVLGGGSTINGMVYSRGGASTYDAWRDMGCEGWGYEDVLPYFRRLEDSDRGPGLYHGVGGPMRVVRARTELPIVHPVQAACIDAGFPLIEDFSTPVPDGVGFYDWMVADGRRASTPEIFPGFRRPRTNLTIATNLLVERVEVEGDRIVGVRVPSGRDGRLIRSEGEVVLCAGAIGSAKLLLQSGIGPADELRALGIRVLADHPQVGRNLQNHITHRITFRCSEPITYARYRNPLRGGREVLRYAFGRKGLFSSGASVFGGYFRSNPDLAAPDMQLFITFALFRPGPGLRMLPKDHGYGLMYNQGTPHSRGVVKLRSADPRDPPLIDPNYLSDSRDMEAMVDAAERLRTIAAAPSLAKITSGEIAPGDAVRTRAAWEEDIRANAGNHYHVSGTCRMGRSIGDSVTDSRLRVHGLRGLRVADAGAMPLLMNGNTNAPVMMVAERAAEFIKAG